jgi:hypothetical protein
MTKMKNGLFHSIVTGLNPLGDFMEKQNLLEIALKHKGQYERRANEAARLVGQRFWAFRHLQDKGRSTPRLQAAFQDWKQSFLHYMGYTAAKGFEPHMQDVLEGAALPVWLSKNHGVAILDLCSHEVSEFDLDTPFDLASLPGVECKTRVLRRVTLPEVADALLRAGGGFTHALVLTSTHFLWFSADVVTLGSCLQVSLEDILLPDEELRLAFTDFVLGEDAFRTVSEATDEPGMGEGHVSEVSEDEATDEDENNDDDDNTEAGGFAISGPVVTTRAQRFLQEDLESKRRITEELHKQVTTALEILVNHRLSQEALPRNGKVASDLSQAIFKDGLFFVYRILFILFAESKGILRLTMKEYASFYSLESTLDWCDAYPRNVRLGRADPKGHSIWNSLTAIFTLLRRGVDLKGEGRIPAFNGQLFSPDQCELFDQGPALCDAVLVQVLGHLTTRNVDGSRERVHFGNLEIGQLGVVYEALLAQRPKYLAEDHAWVEAHGGGLGLVPKSWIKAFGGTLEYAVVDAPSLSEDDRRQCKGALSTFKKFDDMIDRARPARNPKKGTFVICPSGGAKRQTASFYTPQKLADYLTHRTLKPLVDAARTPEDVLAITVLEPSVGCGAFLVSSMKYLARAFLDRVARDARPHVRVAGVTFSKSDKGAFSESVVYEAKRLVLENCLYGVDTNPLSLELCRVILYLESLSSQRPLPFLHHKLKQGNALVGADLRGRFAQTFGEGKQAATLNWAFLPSLAVFKTQREFLKEKNNDPSIYGAYADAAALHGQKVPSAESALAALEKAEGAMKAARKDLFSGKRGEETPNADFARWCEKQQYAVTKLLGEVIKLEDRFTELQQEAGGVDRQNDLFKDFSSMLPESDPLLIEAEGVPVSDELQHMRKEALEREFGAKVYSTLVHGARATQRLRAFAHFACALQTWPLDLMSKFPSFSDYRATAELLLNADLKKPLSAGALSKSQFASLRAALDVAKRMSFFHADLEFASIMEKGFGAILGNPPWKVLQVKDKDAFPSFDPGFLGAKPSQKRKRLNALAELDPSAAHAWWAENHKARSAAQFWQNNSASQTSMLGYQCAEGKIDLCSLFLLRAEGLLREKGSIGYIVSHSATFITKNTKPLRERFFKQWNLREATVFENRAKIFDIATYITFSTLVGSPDRTRKEAAPQFIQGVTALGDLDSCGASFDGAKSLQPLHHKIEIGKSLIERIFSPEVFAIPLIKDPREIKIAEEILRPRPGLVKLGDVLEHVSQGINGTNGPKSGLSIYREDLAKKGYKVPTFEEMFDPNSPLVPLYKGSFFNHFDPYYLGFGHDQHYGDLDAKKRAWAEQIEQFGVRKKLYENEKTKRFIESEKIAWRGIAGSMGQRMLITSLIPSNSISDGNVVMAMPKEKFEVSTILAHLSCLVSDFFCRFQATSKVTSGIVLNLYASFESSPHIVNSQILVCDPGTALSLEKRIAFEGEMILHFCQSANSLTPEDLVSVFTNRFAALNRAEPNFFPELLAYLQARWAERRQAA